MPRTSASVDTLESEFLSETEGDDEDVSDVWQPLKLKNSTKTAQTRLSLKATALVSQRFGVSDRATAAIVTSAFDDAGLLRADELVVVADRSKIRCEKLKQVSS